MNRKLIKLLTSPRLFFMDMLKKKLAKGSLSIKYLPWLKVRSNHKYSVVSAVYGVEKYLEQFFSSLENQSIDFEKYIELIMVDDGSLDGSAKIIKKWVNRYPHNIKYISKENGGQASARNLGMNHVSNEWVTFIDPDDFVSTNYFAEVDKHISKESDLALVSCNLLFYFEDKNKFSNRHPLNYRFKEDASIFVLPNIEKHVQLSASTAFFKRKTIILNKLEMDIRVNPNFEDAKFVGEYLLSCHGEKVAFIQGAKYYYRKRQDNSSSLDGSWEKKNQYSKKLKFGDLSLLEIAKKQKGNIPDYIQRIVLYDLIWYFRYIVNNNTKLSFLSNEEKAQFLSLLKNIFRYIDKTVIYEFELVSCSSAYKAGWLGFKEAEQLLFDVDIIAYDASKKLIKLRYYLQKEKTINEYFYLDGKVIYPLHEKTRIHNFVGEVFVLERVVWLPIFNDSSLSANIDGIPANYKIQDKKYEGSIPVAEIQKSFETESIDEKSFLPKIRALRYLARLSSFLPSYQNAWVFMDRDVQADDNAEHLYRYVRKVDPNINARFILRKSSHDWVRLEREGFDLIPFGSIRHMIILFNADHLISSHADNYVINYPPHSWFKGILKYRYTFLQHGVIKDDLSAWLNNKPIDIFVTASEREYQSIAGPKNSYTFSTKEVFLTGLARHDELLNKAQSHAKSNNKKTLLIMPTWRQNLVGKTEWMSTTRSKNDIFYSSEYALLWKQLLHSKSLKSMMESYDLRVVFFPHANIAPYLDWFDVPSYIKSLTHHSGQSIQDLFVEASLMLTDYSSVAFEMAYLEKPIIYYQFDSEKVFGGEHTTAKGYFNYSADGFGSVCETEKDVLLGLEKILDSNCKLEDKYLNRATKTFKFKDGKCCQRIYESILDLDKPDASM